MGRGSFREYGLEHFCIILQLSIDFQSKGFLMSFDVLM